MRLGATSRPFFQMCWDSWWPSPTIKSSGRISSILASLGVGISAKTVSRTKPPSLFAIIIGINEYASPSICDLKGAVPDALAVQKYLEGDLGVPRSQICVLCDAEATRAAIIQAINNLVVDHRIHRGDPIFIYYAGYGSEVDAPRDWAADGTKIQMLVPHDLRTNVDSRGTCGIPDRTINALLSRVAENRGDNIVRLSILDSRSTTVNEIYRWSSSTAVTLDPPMLDYQDPIEKHGTLGYQTIFPQI